MSEPAISDRRAFIRAQTRSHRVPHVPELQLFVADEAMEIWQKTEDELGEMGLAPPFWAFAWAGGQALARYLLDHPQIVRGKHVLDVASGSGLVAIAAALAGAATVTASDIDGFAIEAIALNAQHNGVSISVEHTDFTRSDGPQVDVITAGDIFYERETSQTVLTWLTARSDSGTQVLIGDPGRSYLPKKKLRHVIDYHVPVVRSLEDADVKKTSVWRLA